MSSSSGLPRRNPGPAEDVPLGLSLDEQNSFIASGKALTYLTKMDNDGSCGLEKGSVYGAAVAIPQVARSAGWSGTMVALAVRSYLFLFINIFLQVFLLTMIAEEEHIMNVFSGRPHLCDFGKDMSNCPDAPNCRGPLGTIYTPARLYSFDVWATRVYIRDSLKALFPHKHQELDIIADPGEYGIENYYCRLVCCFIFMMSMMDDMYKTLSLVTLLWHVPSDHGTWVRYDVPAWADKGQVKLVHDWSELDLVKFGVAGMPFGWKVINAVVITMPKVLIWWITTSLGMYLLLETAGIVDVIMNALAMTFIINMDEMIFASLTTVATRHIMNALSDYELFEVREDEEIKERAVLDRYINTELGQKRWGKCFNHLVPRRLLACLVLLAVFIWNYYDTYCEKLADGSWTSRPVSLPKDMRFSPWNLFTQKIEREDTPFWTMPEAH